MSDRDTQVRLLIGIDDTDTLESRGTGYRARQLGRQLTDGGHHVTGISRHQLLVDPRIPYTSHNSAACLTVEAAGPRAFDAVIAETRVFLERESAAGSDAGLCVAPADGVLDAVVAFGRQAKTDVVGLPQAHRLADRFALHLEGVTGERIGVIGALAAVGLRASGDDGRVLWLDGLRELSGVRQVREVRQTLPGVAIETITGRPAGDDHYVDLGDWVRPVMRHGRMVLVVEPGEDTDGGSGGTDGADQDVAWIVADRDRIKQLSQ